MKTMDEILLLGSFNFIVTVILFYLESSFWQNISLFHIDNIIIFIQILFLLYLICFIFIDLKFFRYLVAGCPDFAYYLKAIGWVPYAYVIIALIYLFFLNATGKLWIENLCSNYPISLVICILSLSIAWLRRHPRFLAE